MIDSLIEEFAASLKKDGIKVDNCLKNGVVNAVLLDDLCSKVKTKYYWMKIKAKVYAAMISRMTALLHRSKG